MNLNAMEERSLSGWRGAWTWGGWNVAWGVGYGG